MLKTKQKIQSDRKKFGVFESGTEEGKKIARIITGSN